MGKFFRLVKNEYIKVLLKVSTWVMLALVALSIIGYPFIAKYGQWQTRQWNTEASSEDILADYQDQMEYLKNVKTDGWEKEVQDLQYKIDNKITSGWKLDASTFITQIGDGELFQLTENEKNSLSESVDSFIKSDDWNGFYNAAIDTYKNKVSDAETYKSNLDLYSYCIENKIEPLEDNWKYDIASKYFSETNEIKGMEDAKNKGEQIDTDYYNELVSNTTLYKYRLDNNVEFDISENNNWGNSMKFNFWTVFCSSGSLVTVIGVLIIIVAGGIVSSEFSQGTIKFLLINPVKRWKILVSKYFTTITLGYILLLLAYAVSIVMSMILFGADNLGASYLYVADGAVKSMSGFLYVLKNYLLNSMEIIVMSSLAFAISSLVRSSALAIGVSVMAMFGGNTIVLILQQLNFDWARYLIFSNTSLANIMDGNTIFAGQTITSALCVIVVHMIIFLLTAWDGFNKREV